MFNLFLNRYLPIQQALFTTKILLILKILCHWWLPLIDRSGRPLPVSRMELSQFLIDFVTLLDDGDKQCVIIKFIDDAVITHADAVAGITNNFSGIARRLSWRFPVRV